MRLFSRLVFFVGLVTCQLIAATEPLKQTDSLVILTRRGDAVAINVLKEAKPVILAKQPKAFQGVTRGTFVFEDQQGSWFLSHVKDPDHSRQLHPPLQKGESVTGFCPSNAGDRVAWSLHVRHGAGRILITDASTDRPLTSIVKPALGWYGTFSRPAWSPDDQRLAYLYLLTPALEMENEPKASLYVLNIAPNGMETQVLDSFLCNSGSATEVRWIAGGRIAFPMMTHPLLAGGGNDIFSVRSDGKDLRREIDFGDAEVDYLSDGIHTLSHFDGKLLGADQFLVTATLTDINTGITAKRRWTTFGEEGPTFFSSDGSYAAWEDHRAGPPGRWCVTDTRTDQTTATPVLSSTSNDTHVMWMRYEAP